MKSGDICVTRYKSVSIWPEDQYKKLYSPSLWDSDKASCSAIEHVPHGSILIYLGEASQTLFTTNVFYKVLTPTGKVGWVESAGLDPKFGI